MSLSISQRREQLKTNIEKELKENYEENNELHKLLKNWTECYNDIQESDRITKEIKTINNKYTSTDFYDYIKNNLDLLSYKPIWILGGDGWAYDIGYGGLDHVLSMDNKVNVMVLDTEVYSNTGGQASKATARSAVAKFASLGKSTKKKDLGMIAMSYGHIYVGSIAIGANPKHAVDTIIEAQNFPGPSLILAYSSCIGHGIKGGLSNLIQEQRSAVDNGYWLLYRYNPLLKEPLILDSKPNFKSIKEFMENETRFSSLKRSNQEETNKIKNELIDDCISRYMRYLKLSGKNETSDINVKYF